MRHLLFFLFTLLNVSPASGQGRYECEGSRPFRRGNLILFSDDFSEDSAGAYPHKWGDNPIPGKDCVRVAPSDTGNHMLITCSSHVLMNLTPKMNREDAGAFQNYLTLEFSFRFLPGPDEFGAAKKVYWKFSSRKSDSSLAFNISEHGVFGCNDGCYVPREKRTYEARDNNFNNQAWHHVKMDLQHGSFSLWLDGDCIMANAGCGLQPVHWWIGGIGPVALTDIVLATNATAKTFNRILTGDKFITHNINFEINSAQIRNESEPYLQLLVQFLQEHRGLRVEISGHTDSTGSDEHNLALSKSRAEAVKHFLMTHGIKSERLETAGWGAAKPVSTNSTADGRWQNRRVEFRKLAQ